MSMQLFLRLLSIALTSCILSCFAADKKIVFLAGSASHGKGEHEFNAGCQLLKKCLDSVPGIKTELHKNGWPTDEKAFEGADAIFIYCDGGEGHPFNKPERREVIDNLMKRGVGLGCAHFAVEVPKGPTGDAFLEWIGGYFEPHWSVNPHWEANFKSLPQHPITRGVNQFKINDEWYYHMRFRERMQGVTPILSDLPPAKTLAREDGPHSGNPAVREAIKRGEPQHVMWAAERAGGGRGFGFTGGHFHKNWGDENFRKIVLNAILWSAKAEVPESGVESRVTADDLQQNLDKK
jgi:type 1 glutamine amidotransferase